MIEKIDFRPVNERFRKDFIQLSVLNLFELFKKGELILLESNSDTDTVFDAEYLLQSIPIPTVFCLKAPLVTTSKHYTIIPFTQVGFLRGLFSLMDNKECINSISFPELNGKYYRDIARPMLYNHKISMAEFFANGHSHIETCMHLMNITSPSITEEFVETVNRIKKNKI